MVEIQFAARKLVTAVLASVTIPRVDVEPTEPHLPLGDTVVGDQQDDSRNAHDAVDEANRLVVHRQTEIGPAVKVKSAILFVYGVSDVLIKQRECASDGRNMNRQK
jgi:hypothetical protein